MTAIMGAHNIPYVAQVSPHNWRDTVAKAKKGFDCDGPSFINGIVPCPRGWRCPSDNTIEVAKLAVETCIWPLYEVVDGEYALTAESLRIADGKVEKKPITDWINSQGRFRHLREEENAPVVEEMQKHLDQSWEKLVKRSKN